MKNLLLLIGLSVLLINCDSNKIQKPKPQVCDFGLEQNDFNQTKRELPDVETNAARVKPLRQPEKGKGKPTTPPSTTDTSRSVLLLDFNGHTVVNTNWNYMPEIVCNPSGLTIEQQQQVLDSVASRYSQFYVQVTTDENAYANARPRKRMRCIITESWEWYGRAGGVSYVNSFTWGNDTPCFVFSLLLNYSTKKIQEAVAHELGHTFGLYHQAVWDSACIKLADYNTGCCGWAPIMGVGYYQPNVTWHTGANSLGCTNYQNDSLIIKQKL